MADFLFEIGLEEVPARMIAGAEAELLKRTLALLAREQLIGAEPVAKSYSTPRRLAVLVENVREQQDDITEEVTGPAVKIAFKDGVPTPAAEAFARKNGIAVAELKTITTPKGEYLAANVVKKGRSAAEVIASELPKEIAGIYWAKNMYWRAGKPERFVRPVLWMVCLLGETVVPVEFAGKTAGRASFGHRVLSSGEAFEIQSPESYLAQLEGEYVLADVEARRHKIRKALDKVTREVAGARWREDEALVDAVTHLTEWPDVLLGNFEPAYLELPEEVLVTVMRDHQKYFAVEDASGKLASHFLTVTNIALDETNTPIIQQGNERVLRARFNDARFFWNFDQKISLKERVKLLNKVMFQNELGTYADKSERVRKIGCELGRIAAMHVVPFDLAAISEAAELAKADLTTELVKEFTELQGVIGGRYAELQSIRPAVANIIYDQYLPANMGDDVPRSLEGAVFGIADRADTIAGMFRLGMEPTGSKDPFALRRAANGIVKILAETPVSLSIENIISYSISVGVDQNGIASLSMKTAASMRSFFKERIEFYLRDVKGIAYDVVAAVLARSGEEKYGTNDLHKVIAIAEAVSSMRGSADFLAVSSAFKRMKNILAQAREKGLRIESQVSPVSFAGAAEIALAQELTLRAPEIENLASGQDYEGALLEIAKFRPLLDEFFAAVMIMVDDEQTRANRLGLLQQLEKEFSCIADFSEIVTVG